MFSEKRQMGNFRKPLQSVTGERYHLLLPFAVVTGDRHYNRDILLLCFIFILTNLSTNVDTFFAFTRTLPVSFRTEKSTSKSKCKCVTMHSSGTENEEGSLSLSLVILTDNVTLYHLTR